MKVFVYGALMDEPTMRERGEPGVLIDHATRFTARGFTFLEPRFLALEPAPGEVAHGVVVELDRAAWRAMSAHEHGYAESTVQVQIASGEVEAVTLVLTEAERVSEGLPSARYAERLVRGARAAGLPLSVIERYEAAARRGSPWTRYLIPLVDLVRGTLRR